MNFKQQLRCDLSSEAIKSICNKLYFLHKPESVKTDTYIEYQIIDKKYINYAGDNNLGEKYLIQVDIFSSGDYTELQEVIEKEMKHNDYRLVTQYDLFENDTNLYHCVFRFNKYI